MLLLLLVRLIPLTESFPFDLPSHWPLSSSPTFLAEISAPLVLEKKSRQSFRVLKDTSGCPILNTFDHHNSTNHTICQCQSVYGSNLNETITARHFSRLSLPVWDCLLSRETCCRSRSLISLPILLPRQLLFITQFSNLKQVLWLGNVL